MSEFPPDFIIEFDQQIYRPLCVRPHVKQDGSEIRVIEWLTNCPLCGGEFTAVTTMKFAQPRRRCDACKAPGRRVKTDRKKTAFPCQSDSTM